MNCKILVVLALVALTAADGDHDHDDHSGYSYNAPQQESLEEYYGPAKYDFSYAVKDDDSGNDFGHQETRDGDRTEGSRFVQLSDGRLQKVTYYVDGESGFVSEVTYEGEAHYPEPESAEEGYHYAPPPSPPKALYEAP